MNCTAGIRNVWVAVFCFFMASVTYQYTSTVYETAALTKPCGLEQTPPGKVISMLTNTHLRLDSSLAPPT